MRAALALTMLGVALAHTGPVGDNDIGFHLRIGEETWQTLRPPSFDFHSHTAPGAPYAYHEWLSQILPYGVWRLGEDAGLVLWRGLTAGAAVGLAACAMRGPIVLRLAVAALVFGLGLEHSQVRPHVLGWAFTGLASLLLERGAFRAVPPLLVVWANCHGSVALGAGMAVLHLVERAAVTHDRRPLGWAALAVVAPLLNPYGAHAYLLFFENGRRGRATRCSSTAASRSTGTGCWTSTCARRGRRRAGQGCWIGTTSVSRWCVPSVPWRGRCSPTPIGISSTSTTTRSSTSVAARSRACAAS